MPTLYDALTVYLDRAPDLRSGHKLRHQVNCWQRHIGDTDLATITTQSITVFRLRARQTLSPWTIEKTISDLLTIIRHSGMTNETPSPGRRLNLPAPRATQPTLEELGRVYAAAETARWPIRPIRVGWNCNDKQAARVAFWRGFLTLAYFTGLRLDDLLQLTWSNVTAQRINRTAGKTCKHHVWPLCTVITRHLEQLHQLHAPRLLHVSPNTTQILRDHLATLCRAADVEPFTPKMIRRLSITQWATASPEAGRIVHGSGIGVLQHYYDPEQLLRAALPRFHWPEEMLSQEEQQTKHNRELRLLHRFHALDSPGQDTLIALAERMS